MLVQLDSSEINSPHNNGILSRYMTVESNLTSVTCLCRSEYMIVVSVTLSCRHKHVTDEVKLDSTVVHLDKIPLLWGLASECMCTYSFH